MAGVGEARATWGRWAGMGGGGVGGEGVDFGKAHLTD